MHRRIPLLAVLFFCCLMAACKSQTPFGRCVGLNDHGRDSSLVYEYSVRNIAVGVLFSETVIVPVVVVFKQLECPVAIDTTHRRRATAAKAGEP